MPELKLYNTLNIRKDNHFKTDDKLYIVQSVRYISMLPSDPSGSLDEFFL